MRITRKFPYPEQTIAKHLEIANGKGTDKVIDTLDDYFDTFTKDFPLDGKTNPLLTIGFEYQIKDGHFDWIDEVKSFYNRLLLARGNTHSLLRGVVNNQTFGQQLNEIMELTIGTNLLFFNETLISWAKGLGGKEDLSFSFNDLMKKLDADLEKLFKINKETISNEYFLSLVVSRHNGDDQDKDIRNLGLEEKYWYVE